MQSYQEKNPTKTIICLYFALFCTAFSCEAGEFLEMSSQQCTACAAGSYSLGSGVRFDQWDSIPAEFNSFATYMEPEGGADEVFTCNKSVVTLTKKEKEIVLHLQFKFVQFLVMRLCVQFIMDTSGYSLGIESG